MKTHIELAFCIVALTALCACTTTYLPPTTGPTAKLRIQVPLEDYHVRNYMWNGKACEAPKAELGVVGAPRHLRPSDVKLTNSTLGMLGERPPSTTRVERLIPAEQPVFIQLFAALSVSGSFSQYTITACNQTIEFLPKDGKQYEITHMPGPTGCSVAVEELVPTSSGFSRVPVQNVGSHKCKASAGKQWLES